MQLANLKSRELGQTSESVSLLVWTNGQPESAGIFVRAGLAESGLLTSVRVGCMHVDLIEAPLDASRLAPDNPYSSREDLAALDENGLVRVGARLNEGGLLASIVRVLSKEKSSSPQVQVVEDCSEVVPDFWEGAIVRDIRRRTRKQIGRGAPGNLIERIEIDLQAEDVLELGDVLVAGNETLGVVSQFVPDEAMPRSGGQVADLIVPKVVAARLLRGDGLQSIAISKSADLGKFQVRAVDQGVRALITKLPLARSGTHPTLHTPYRESPAAITADQVRWLGERKLTNLIGEFVSLKSDDDAGRRAVQQLMKENSPLLQAPPPDTPASLYVIRAELLALGLNVETIGGETPGLKLLPATREELLRHSQGEVKKPDTINYRSYLPEALGILAGEIFGEEGDLYQFGHFQLAMPVVPYLWRVGEPSLLSTLLALNAEDIERIVNCRAYIRRGDQGLEWREVAEPFPSADEAWQTDATAILALLQTVPAERVPPGLRDRLPGLVQDVLLLPPVFIRPLVLLDSGNFATSDLNELYRRVVNRSNRLRKLEELKAPPAILVNERQMLQQTVDQLWANGLLPEEDRAHRDEGRPLKDVSHIALSGHLSANFKRVDWSGRARIVVDERLADDAVELPSAIVDKLRLQDGDVVLLTLPLRSVFVAGRAKTSAGNLIRVSRTAGMKLRLVDGVTLCDVHRPLRPDSVLEATRLLGKGLTPARTAEDHPLYESADVGEALASLAQLVASGGPLPLTGPRGLLLGGAGVFEFRADNFAVSKSKQKLLEVPVPPATKPRYSEPTFEQIRQVVEANRRPACIFTAERFAGSLEPRAGRVGGLPCLPPDVEWPKSHNKSLPFLAQLPLDSLLNMPDAPHFPPGSLLTIFWGGEWWASLPASGLGPVFIVSGDNLAERAAPADDLLIEQCRLTATLEDEVPVWSEMQEILDLELERPDPAILRKYKTEAWDQHRSAQEVIKVGGWPHWIQGAESEHPFVAQLASPEGTELNFGDSGSLYFTLSPAGKLSVVMQCY